MYQSNVAAAAAIVQHVLAAVMKNRAAADLWIRPPDDTQVDRDPLPLRLNIVLTPFFEIWAETPTQRPNTLRARQIRSNTDREKSKG